MKGFLQFIRQQGVVGLAVGFLVGGAVSKVVASLVSDIINPLFGVLFGAAGNLKDASLHIGSSEILWGNFLTVVIDFLVVALVVYFGVKLIGLEKFDVKKK